MFKNRFLPWTLAVLLAGALTPKAAALESVAMPGSIRPVGEAPQAGPLDPHKAVITRTVLKAEESEAPLNFEMALKLRNLPELEARVARGERIPREEMAGRYEPQAADYEAVAAWAASQGLTITRRDPHHMALFVRGKISRIQTALQVRFARVSFEGEEYSSAITAPSLPAALSPLLVGVNGLQPHLHPHRHLIRRQAQPDASSGGASYFPKQIAQAYNATALYDTDIAGSGEAIAIVIDTFPAASDLVAFWQAAGVNQTLGNIQFIQAVPGQLPEPSGEETLDTEWSSSMAPSAHVRVYAVTDLANSDIDEGYEQVYNDVMDHPELGIHQMSMSFGEGEQYTTDSQMQTDDGYFASLAGQGVTIFASSGDDGSTPGADGTGDESGPVQVESPANDTYVNGVGGTTLVLNSSNEPITETVWNENGGSSGGGFSNYFARPAWQTGQGVSSVNRRQVPDIAAPGDPEYGAVIVEGGVQQTVGGTSWSSPTWAGLCALLNQARANSGQDTIGILGKLIYPLLNSTNYPGNYQTNFRDITSGNNATDRSNGDYSATAGYDLCTGLGTPHVQSLAELLVGSSTLVGIQNPAAVESVTPGESGTFTVAVGGATATYQWQREAVGTATWSNLTDDGTYSGSTGPTLTIGAVSAAMSGDQFQCMVTIGSIAVTTSPPSVLVVDSPLKITTLAGKAGVAGIVNGTGKAAEFNYPSGVAVDGSGNLYVADYGNNQIREVTPGGVVSTPYGNLQGNFGSANGSGNNAYFKTPNDVAIDGSGNLYVADTGNSIIRKISNGYVSTLAGGGDQFNGPGGIAVDGSGNVYVADSGNDTIREITPGGAVTTIAGQTGNAGYADGDATSVALFNNPIGIAVDGMGNVYVADTGNSVVRKISGGTVTTVAGQAGVAGYLDGLGTDTLFNAPFGVAVDGSGNLYVTDCQAPVQGSTAAGNDVVREIAATGVVSTIAGEPGTNGITNGTGSAAQFYSVQAIALSGSGEFYLADTYNQTIRAGTSTTAAGKVISLSGDLIFGEVTVGGTATSTLTINNTGNTVLTVTGITYPDGFSGDWASGTVPAGGSQAVEVSFTPTAEAGYGGEIVVSSDATSGSGAIAVSGTGVSSLSSIVAPTVSTGTASDVNSSSATLNAIVNPEGAATTVYFEYGTSVSYTSVSGSGSAGAGTTNTAFSLPISGLMPQTTYHFQAVATNAGETTYGGDQTFTTPAFTLVPVVASGASATGVRGADYAAIGNPAINASDDVAFRATLVPGAGSVTGTDDIGIWAQNASGTRELVARTGGIAAGTSDAVFAGLSDPVYNDGEAVAFIGTLKVSAGHASAGTATGIWSNSAGLLSLVAREGSQAAGFPAGVKFRAFDAVGLPDQGGALFLASASNGKRGIWAGDSAASLQLIVGEGKVYGGETVTNLAFLPSLLYVNGQSRSFAQGTGDIVCHASFSDRTTGILEVAGTSARILAQSGDGAAGLSGAEYSAFGNPAINGSDDIAFAARLKVGAGGVTAAGDSGIWADDSTGTLRLIALTGGAAAPGVNAAFRTLDDPVYNDNEAVAFRGTLKTGAGEATAASAAGVWSNSSGSLKLIAQQGGVAPGCQGATFKAFNSIALPDQGGVVILATLNASGAFGVSSVNNTGIWAVDTAGSLQLIARKGDIVNGEQIKSLSFLPILPRIGSQTRNFSQTTGDLVYQVTFADQTTAIFEVTFQ
jgi:kumamolisin